MNAYVLDASVAAKWFLPPAGETYVEEALEVLAGYAAGRIALLHGHVKRVTGSNGFEMKTRAIAGQDFGFEFGWINPPLDVSIVR